MGARPSLSLTVVGTLALGVGANTAVFSAIDAVLLRPLPYPDPERLLVLEQRGLKHERAGGSSPRAPGGLEPDERSVPGDQRLLHPGRGGRGGPAPRQDPGGVRGPRIGDVGPDWRLFVYAALCAAVVTLLSGLLPALQARSSAPAGSAAASLTLPGVPFRYPVELTSPDSGFDPARPVTAEAVGCRPAISPPPASRFSPETPATSTPSERAPW